MSQEIKSVVNGVILDIKVSAGDTVQMDQDLLSVESMKMEIPVKSNVNGEVVEVKVKKGDFISESDVLIVVK